MSYLLGVVLFALAILISVSLHEAGHMLTAKAFGMKVTRYFVGFGPTLWSFKRGETEYGVKGIPLGGFCKIVGMTPQDDDVEPGDEKRAMWRYPVWKRTIVMSAGSITHFALALIALWIIAVSVGLPNPKFPSTEAGFRAEPELRRVTAAGGAEVGLTGAEFDLLMAFLERPGRILSRDQLLDITRGREAGPFDRSIDVLVSRLRRKLGDQGAFQILKTLRNGGYQLSVRVDVEAAS